MSATALASMYIIQPALGKFVLVREPQVDLTVKSPEQRSAILVDHSKTLRQRIEVASDQSRPEQSRNAGGSSNNHSL